MKIIPLQWFLLNLFLESILAGNIQTTWWLNESLQHTPLKTDHTFRVALQHSKWNALSNLNGNNTVWLRNNCVHVQCKYQEFNIFHSLFWTDEWKEWQSKLLQFSLSTNNKLIKTAFVLTLLVHYCLCVLLTTKQWQVRHNFSLSKTSGHYL